MTDVRAWIGNDGNLYATREIDLIDPESGESVNVHEFLAFVDSDGDVEWEEYEEEHEVRFVKGVRVPE